MLSWAVSVPMEARTQVGHQKYIAIKDIDMLSGSVYVPCPCEFHVCAHRSSGADIKPGVATDNSESLSLGSQG